MRVAEAWFQGPFPATSHALSRYTVPVHPPRSLAPAETAGVSGKDSAMRVLLRISSGVAIALLLALSVRARAEAQVLPTAAELRAQHDAITGGGPWRFAHVPCTEGTVQGVVPRLQTLNQHVFTAQDFRASGVIVTVRLAEPTAFVRGVPMRTASVTHYQDDFDNDIMAAERRGDRVQVCLMSFPTPTYIAAQKQYGCDPDKDPRGWRFRVYDYRQHAAYYGSSSEHDCGGA